MPDELIGPENLTKDLLKSIFDAAMMDVEVDDEGDLFVRDASIGCYVLPSDAKDRIRLLAFFKQNENVSHQDKLEVANEINRQYVFVRVAVLSNGRVSFDCDIPVSGGLTKKALVMVTKRFLSIPRPAIQDCDTKDVFA